MERIGSLFDAFVENDLTPGERDELCAGLRQSDELVDDFVRESFLHSQLFSIVREKSLHHRVMALPARSADDQLATPLTCRVVDESGSYDGMTRRINPRLVLTLAGSLVLAAMAIVWTGSRPRTVAQLTQTTVNVSWAQGASWIAGTLLQDGQELRIDKGRALVTMVSGARVILEGPGALRMEGENKVQLHSGRLGAIVPSEATGFIVSTSLGDFVDLGTEFTLELAPKSGCKLYVFSGLVEVRPTGHSANDPPFRVPQSDAVNYDAATGEAKHIPFSSEQRLSL
jgi:hypothetical protein